MTKIAKNLEESQNNDSRNKNDDLESTTKLVDRIETWLYQNQNLIQKIDKSKIQNYQSNYVQLNVEKVTGLIFIIDPSQYT